MDGIIFQEAIYSTCDKPISKVCLFLSLNFNDGDLMSQDIKQEVKEGEKKLKEITGGKLVRSRVFFRKMALNGIKNKEKTLHHVRTQVKKELKEGSLKASDVERRVDELLLEASPNARLITEDEVNAVKAKSLKSQIVEKGKVAISIPYQKSGVNDAIVGGAFLGEWGAVMGSLNEGNVSWKATELLFMDEGISIKSTGQVVLYENINKVLMGEKGFAFTIVTVITHSGENLVYRTGNQNAEASKLIIEENAGRFKIPQNPQVESEKSDADELLKYAQLLEKGLITREEFDMKKAQLLGVEKPDLMENDEKPKFCPNCGTPKDEDSNFCANCGEDLRDLGN